MSAPEVILALSISAHHIVLFWVNIQSSWKAKTGLQNVSTLLRPNWTSAFWTGWTLKVGFHHESHTWRKNNQIKRPLACSSLSRYQALHRHRHQTQNRLCQCPSVIPLQLPCSPLVLTISLLIFQNQGSLLQEGCWERLLFIRTLSKSKELLYNTAIQYYFSFNRCNKG